MNLLLRLHSMMHEVFVIVQGSIDWPTREPEREDGEEEILFFALRTSLFEESGQELNIALLRFSVVVQFGDVVARRHYVKALLRLIMTLIRSVDTRLTEW